MFNNGADAAGAPVRVLAKGETFGYVLFSFVLVGVWDLSVACLGLRPGERST